MDKCEFCGAPAIPMQHCLCDEAVALVRELDAKLRARYYPKPATTEPPEWKSVGDGYEVQSFPDGSNRVRYVGQTKPFATTPPQPSPLDRALEDFTARGKAKRCISAAALPDTPCRYCGMLADAHREDCDRPDPPPWRYHPRDCPDLSRALSTPLPHDPDIHTRLMPWKGKADE